MSRHNWIIGIGILLIIVIAGIFINNYLSHSSNDTAQNTPELKDILDTSNQEKQFLAARKLAERVGIEQSLDILYASPLPKTGEGHLVVHQIGFFAYKKYGVDAVAKCRDYFLYACYHGAIIEASSDKGFEIIPKMTDRCKESRGRYFQCVHAAGHALVAMWNYDIPKALAMCDEFYENDTTFPGVATSCHNGAFMENIFGVHDWGSGRQPKRDWLSDTDPYYPCNQFEEKYQEGCWLNQASRIFHMQKGDIAKTVKSCDEIGNEQHTAWCTDSLARQINGLTYGDPLATYGLCEQMGNQWYGMCVVVNAEAFYSVSGRAEAIAVCANEKSNIKTDCYNSIIGIITGDSLDQMSKEQLCRKMEAPFSDECLKLL